MYQTVLTDFLPKLGEDGMKRLNAYQDKGASQLLLLNCWDWYMFNCYMLLFSTLLCKKIARALGGNKILTLTKLAGENRLGTKFGTISHHQTPSPIKPNPQTLLQLAIWTHLSSPTNLNVCRPLLTERLTLPHSSHPKSSIPKTHLATNHVNQLFKSKSPDASRFSVFSESFPLAPCQA